jgi:predicted CoA-binding protein
MRAESHSKVAVLGASTNEERYSNKAVLLLKEYDHQPIPVHPAGHIVHGLQAKKSLAEINEPVDTLSMYVGPKISSQEYDSILKLGPRRVIFNPGAENAELADKLKSEGIEVVEACTLVMLRTEQF